MTLSFPQPSSIPSEAALRREVRAFLADHAAAWSSRDRARSWIGFDRDFSRAVGARGWIGMTLPRPYGHGRSHVERYIVVEEMLAAGAPVGAHWIADRQSAPLIVKRGTERQKQLLVPGIVRGETCFCIGMSEPASGSDLASITSRATRLDGGWRLDGRKVWTTGAHHADFMIALFRTGQGGSADRQEGLTQFLVDMRSSGLEIRGIRDLTGERHFNEVLFDGVFVPEDMVLGEPGNGWTQVIAELAHERSGPERYMSAFPLFLAALRQTGETIDGNCLGEAIADYVTLRLVSLSVAGQMDAGSDIAQAAALAKELGADLEQRTPDVVRRLVPDPDEALSEMIDYVTCVAPTFSIRGGTREIMRGLSARGLGLR